MRSQETIMVPTVVKIYGCDSCDFVWRDNQGRSRYGFPIQTCTYCGKDMCKDKCMTVYDEDGNPEDWFNPDALACPQCKPHADQVWAVATEIAERHDIMSDLIKEVHKRWDHYKEYIDVVPMPPRVNEFPELL